MTTFNEIQARTAQILEDTGGTRYESGLLEQALRLALDTLDQRLPLILMSEMMVEGDSRDQTLAGLKDCLYLIHLQVQHGGRTGAMLEPESGFSYQLSEGTLQIHFVGRHFPKSGDGLCITYAARHRLEGLDGATETTVPAAYESALVSGAAGHACLLRATGLSEAYGVRPEETTRLMEISKLRLDEYGRTLGALKMIQEFGFPPGFELDEVEAEERSRW